jgi:CheY-like chemotaxis protein
MFMNQELIGFFSVDDCVKSRTFTDEEMKMMSSTGLMFSSVFHRVEQAAVLKRRGDLLQSVNRATHFLLNTSTDTFYNALQEAMRVIAQAIQVDRVFIFKNFKIDGIPHCTQVHEWVATGIESMTGSPLATDVSYYDAVPLDWHEQFNRGEIVHGIVSTFPDKARNHFIPGDVVSSIFVPIFKDRDFWGFIGFDDCANERHFTKDEAEILRSFGFLFINALERGKKGTSSIVDGGAAYIGKRVLLVEDVELNRDIVKALLEDSGIIIDCVENGFEAMTKLVSESVKYDMVLMDLAMPVMDGYEATRRIRQKYPITELPIIALTGNITMEVIDQCNAVGMNDFISKPIDIDKFFALLRNATAHK